MRLFAFNYYPEEAQETEIGLSTNKNYYSVEFTRANSKNKQETKVDYETVIDEGFEKLFIFITNNWDLASSTLVSELFDDASAKQEVSWRISFDCTDIRFSCKSIDVYTPAKVTVLYNECKKVKTDCLITTDKVLSSLGLKDTIFDDSDLKEYMGKFVDEYIKDTNANEGIQVVIFELNNADDMVRTEINKYFDKDDYKKYNYVVYDTICKEMLKLHNANLKSEEKQLNIDDYKATIFNSVVESVKATFKIAEESDTYEPDVSVKTIGKLLKENYQAALQKYDTQENDRKTKLRNKLEAELKDIWKSNNVTLPLNANELIEKEFEIRNLMHEFMKINVDLKEEDARTKAIEQLIAGKADELLKSQQQKITKEQATLQAKAHYGIIPDETKQETSSETGKTSTPDPSKSTEGTKKEGLSTGVIVAIVLGSIFGVLFIALGLYYVFILKKKRNISEVYAVNKEEAI